MSVIKGQTKSGIKFELDSRIKDDARLLFLLTRAQNTEDVMVSTKAVMDILSLIFGSEDNVLVFMSEVALKHDGVCEASVLIKEIQEMFEALSSKN